MIGAAALVVPAFAVLTPGSMPAGAAVHRPAPMPVTRAYPQSRQGTLPPTVPSQNIPPSPNFLLSCTGTQYDDSQRCVSAVLQALDNAREREGLPGFVLPTNWVLLSPEEQMFVVTNLERTVRGLPPLSGLASALDQSSEWAAANGADPSPPGSFPWSSWGGNWAGAMGNPLEAIYYWMYDDGLGSNNTDCTPSNQSGCWGHRTNLLMALACGPCVMGSGFNATGWQGDPAWTELLVDTSGNPALDVRWGQILPYLPGSPGGEGLIAPAVGIASTPDGQGYWLVAGDGGVFSFGDAHFYNSMAGAPLVSPVVGIASTPDGLGYWEVASDGGIFAFGDAAFYGSMGGHRLARPVVGIAPTGDGRGYWEVASDGGIFAFGDAPFRGSTGGHALNAPVVSMSAPSTNGYWLAAADGGIFSFGLPYEGSMG